MSKLIKKRRLSLHELMSILNLYLPESGKDSVMILPNSSTSLTIQRIVKNAKTSGSSKLLQVNPKVLEQSETLPKIYLVTPNSKFK